MREAIQAEALHRAKDGISDANYPVIIRGFAARGIPESEILPRENVFTYHAWKALGRQVKRGEHGVKVLTVIEKPAKDEEGDGKEKKIRIQRRAVVFHISQTRELGGEEERSGGDGAKQKERFERPDSGVAASLREKASAMQRQIDAKRNPAIGRQRPTRRRLSILDGMRRDAERLEKVQQGLRAIAEAIDRGDLPESLHDIRHKSQVEEILLGWKNERPEDKAWLEARLEGKTPEQERQDRIRDLERKLVGSKIPGFFPTPKPIVERMLQLAQVQPGLKVLEPSAGKGDIAEAVVKAGAEARCFEINSTLREILATKRDMGVPIYLEGDDFTEASPEIHGTFDRIVMNPPFERGQDVEHIQRAYEFLEEGGILVSVVSEGPFFRGDKKSEAFREWLEEECAYIEPLPDGAFKDSFNPTGVKTRLVMIEK